MSKKRITIIISLLCVLFLLTGCSMNDEAIELSTPISSVTDEGIISLALVYPLAQAINYLSSKINVFWGITIVATLLNAIIIALTFKSNVSMQRMQGLQADMQKIQMKYEGRDDTASKQRMQMEMQQLYTKNGINPLGGLLVTFLQLPILFAMYAAVRRADEVRHGVFMGASLSLTPKEAIGEKAWVLVVIYALMIIFQLISTNVARWIQISRDKKEAELHHKHYEKPAQNNLMMTYGMVIFIGAIMFSWPTALSLYYVIYSVINIVKTIIIDLYTHKNKEEA